MVRAYSVLAHLSADSRVQTRRSSASLSATRTILQMQSQHATWVLQLSGRVAVQLARAAQATRSGARTRKLRSWRVRTRHSPRQHQQHRRSKSDLPLRTTNGGTPIHMARRRTRGHEPLHRLDVTAIGGMAMVADERGIIVQPGIVIVIAIVMYRRRVEREITRKKKLLTYLRSFRGSSARCRARARLTVSDLRLMKV